MRAPRRARAGEAATSSAPATAWRPLRLFNDAIVPIVLAYWVNLVAQVLPAMRAAAVAACGWSPCAPSAWRGLLRNHPDLLQPCYRPPMPNFVLEKAAGARRRGGRGGRGLVASVVAAAVTTGVPRKSPPCSTTCGLSAEQRLAASAIALRESGRAEIAVAAASVC